MRNNSKPPGVSSKGRHRNSKGGSRPDENLLPAAAHPVDAIFDRARSSLDVDSRLELLKKLEAGLLARGFREADAKEEVKDNLIRLFVGMGISEYARRVVKEESKLRQDDGGSVFRHRLPALPKNLSWPFEDYDDAPEFGKRGGLEGYLTRLWKPLLPYIDMPTLREHWPRLSEAIDRQRRRLPSTLLPPVKRELTDRLAATHKDPAERPARVDWALRNRAYRARQKEQKL